MSKEYVVVRVDVAGQKPDVIVSEPMSEREAWDIATTMASAEGMDYYTRLQNLQVKRLRLTSE